MMLYHRNRKEEGEEEPWEKLPETKNPIIMTSSLLITVIRILANIVMIMVIIILKAREKPGKKLIFLSSSH